MKPHTKSIQKIQENKQKKKKAKTTKRSLMRNL